MLQKMAMIFGAVFLLLGVLGFIPGITTIDGRVLGLFAIDVEHNIIHLLSGALGVWAGMTSLKAAKTYFQVFGVLYGLVAVVGFWVGDGLLLGFVNHNMADTFLHLVIAALALYLGFAVKAAQPAASPVMS